MRGLAAHLGHIELEGDGIETRNLASRAAAAILEALGLESVEAAKRAAEPLPQLETKASFE